MLARLRPYWPLVTLAFSGAMLAAAIVYFQNIRGLAPCPLCLDQRNWHWAVVGVSLGAMLLVRLRPGMTRWAVVAPGLVLLGSAAMGMYHVAVEQHWVIAQCDVRAGAGESWTFDLNAPLEVPRCDEIAWQFAGVSMAGWNAIASFVVALLSYAVAFAPEKKV